MPLGQLSTCVRAYHYSRHDCKGRLASCCY